MSNSDDIVIVSGLPRSGTSMMMQMIEAGGISALTDSVRTADADNPRGYFEFELVKKIQQDSSWLEQARGKVVKMVHLLLLNLPAGYQYRIVLMVRDHRQVLASQAAMLKRQGKIGANLSDEPTGNRSRSIGEGLRPATAESRALGHSTEKLYSSPSALCPRHYEPARTGRANQQFSGWQLSPECHGECC